MARLHPDWNLVILGEGEQRSSLEQQVTDRGLEGRVKLPGLVEDPFGILRACDIFALSSLYEGQGLALVEALACGLPAVSFDCPSGPAQIVRDGVDGFLLPVGDVDALARALDRLMADGELRQRMAARAPEVTERFAVDAIVRRWEDLFLSSRRSSRHQLA
jgi:glycosyltransferase involved in cell wall biosynthesis